MRNAFTLAHRGAAEPQGVCCASSQTVKPHPVKPEMPTDRTKLTGDVEMAGASYEHDATPDLEPPPSYCDTMCHKLVSKCNVPTPRLWFASKRANIVLALCFCSWAWIMVTTFAPAPVGLLTIHGTVCPRPTVCAETWYAMTLLAISRGSAYATYPIMILLFLSKANNLRTYLQ